MLKRFVFWITPIVLVVTLGVFVGAVQAQAADLPPLTEPGPYGVAIKMLQPTDPSRENWTVETTVWFPADPSKDRQLTSRSPTRMGAVPDLSGAPYPLIIFSHGVWGTNTQLSHVMEYLASQGYVVVAPWHHDTQPIKFELVDRPLDIMLVLDQLAAITDGDLTGMIDTNNVGLIGYSLAGRLSCRCWDWDATRSTLQPSAPTIPNSRPGIATLRPMSGIGTSTPSLNTALS